MSSSNVDRDQAGTVPLWETVGRAAVEISRLALAGPADPAVAEALSALAHLVAGLLEREQPGRRAHVEFQVQVNAMALEWPPEAGHIFARLFAFILGGDAAGIWFQEDGAPAGVLAAAGQYSSTQTDEPGWSQDLRLDGADLGQLAAARPDGLAQADAASQLGPAELPLRGAAGECGLICCALRLAGDTAGLVYVRTPGPPDVAPEAGANAGFLGHALTLGLHRQRLLAEARDSTWRRQAEEAVVASEALSHAVLRSLSAHIAVVDRDGVIVAASDAWINLNQAGSRTSPVHPGVGVSYVDELRQAQGELAEQFRENLAGLQSVLDGTRPEFTREFQYRTPGGRRWYTVHITPLRSPAGGAVISHADVTEQKQAADREALLRAVDARILQDRPLEEILQYVCAQLVDMLGLAVAYIGLKEPDFTVTVRARAGPAGGFLDGLPIRWDDTPAGRGPSGTAIRTGRPRLGDVDTEPEFLPKRERARAFGLRAYLSLPLVVHKEIIGALSLCSSTPHALDAWALGYLLGFANQVAISIQAARHRDQIRLHTAALESTANAVVIADGGGVIRWVNQAFTRLSGYTAAEIIGQTPRILSSGRHPEAFYRQMWETILDGKTWRGELYNRRKDGTVYVEDMTITPVRDDSGAITHFVAIKQDVTERIVHEEQIRHLAMHDPLTNLPNRRALQESLERAVERAQRGRHGALAIMDLDNFMLVNDSLGHMAGDRVLMELGELLERSLGPGDILARLGGDEFAALLDGVSPEQARAVAERLRSAVDGFRFQQEGFTFDPAISIGISPVDGSLDPIAVLSLADRALYGAKELGKNRVVVYQSGADQGVDLAAVSQWIPRVKDALREHRLVLHFQPIIRLGSGQPDHYEALVRLLDEDGGLVMPAVFMPPAERFGLMPQVDRWVVAHVIDVLAESPDLRVFVNLSGASLGDAELLTFIEDQIRTRRIEPARLCFEITETAAVTDVRQAQHWMWRLTALGCRFALDDFGVGFSSFSYLRALPADFVKIDGSFVRHLDTDPTSRSIVQAITAVAHALGKEVIAEWVESREIAEALRALGVEHGQGYYWGPPGARASSGTNDRRHVPPSST